MIVPQSRQLWRMLQYVGWPLLALLAWDIAIVVAYMGFHWDWVGSKNIPLALFGGAISFVVGFRNNSSYGRWWEARGLWGKIVNSSRSFARQVISTMHAARAGDAADAQALHTTQLRLINYQIAYVHALRQHLRGLPTADVVRDLVPAGDLQTLEQAKNVPLAIQQAMGRMLRESKDAGWIDSLEWQAMDRSLDDLANAQGGCERIKNTPLPKQYDYFPTLFIQIYCLVLPIGMVEQLGWFTPLGSTLVGFMFLALDRIGQDLENPFDNKIYDLPLTAITTTIETNLRQLLGETKLPDPIKPVRGVLW